MLFGGSGDDIHPQGANLCHSFRGWRHVRSLGYGLDGAERTQLLRFAWQQYSTVLQAGNAEMILSAVG